MNLFTGGVEITKPSGLAESFDWLEIGDSTKTCGSDALLPWTSGLLRFVIDRVFSGGVWHSSVGEESFEVGSLALRNLSLALCNLWYCWSVTLEIRCLSLESSLDRQELDLDDDRDESTSKTPPLPLLLATLEKLLSRLTEFDAPNSTLLKLLSRLTEVPKLDSLVDLSIFKLMGIVSVRLRKLFLLISLKDAQT